MKITRQRLMQIIKEEYELVYGKQNAAAKKTSSKSKKQISEAKVLNEFAKRAYRLLREAGMSKKVAKRNALKLRAQKARK